MFGYYIEVSKSNLDLVPKEYERKQTTVNAERYFIQELKEREEIILNADEEIKDIEYQIYKEVFNEILKRVVSIQSAAVFIAELDCITTFAHVSEKYGYNRPEIVTNGDLKIVDGRHPVVERVLGNQRFVPNDTYINTTTDQLHVITGPNMSGKSVYIRQVALITLMAHIGCFVPAKEAKISMIDRLFVRSGASDIITEGLSTFMVEMVEAAYILNHATKNSLIVMDEIGRGTSTYDGISIASAIAEYLVSSFGEEGPKTLFATHYHELQNLEDKFKNIKNYQVLVKHENGKPVFLHKVVSGGASHSFGVSVAKMAGVPDQVVTRANNILSSFENGDMPDVPLDNVPSSEGSASKEVAQIIKTLEETDINKTTPIDALNLIMKLKEQTIDL